MSVFTVYLRYVLESLWQVSIGEGDVVVKEYSSGVNPRYHFEPF